MMQNRNIKRITAWVAMFAILFVMLFSSVFIAHHTHHECTGDDCPICCVLEMCANTLRSVGTAVIAVAITFVIVLSLQENVQRICATVVNCSLISQKVRMNN